jgi:hypothetical protein
MLSVENSNPFPPQFDLSDRTLQVMGKTELSQQQPLFSRPIHQWGVGVGVAVGDVVDPGQIVGLSGGHITMAHMHPSFSGRSLHEIAGMEMSQQQHGFWSSAGVSSGLDFLTCQVARVGSGHLTPVQESSFMPSPRQQRFTSSVGC